MAFSDHVAAALGSYVYRLIDPRNGETFYGGKGHGNQVFAHVRGELGAPADALTEKSNASARFASMASKSPMSFTATA